MGRLDVLCQCISSDEAFRDDSAVWMKTVRRNAPFDVNIDRVVQQRAISPALRLVEDVSVLLWCVQRRSQFVRVGMN
jgi:hypothetical protein